MLESIPGFDLLFVYVNLSVFGNVAPQIFYSWHILTYSLATFISQFWLGTWWRDTFVRA